MELLFGRFPHLVENIFSLLDAETLFHCSRIDKIWNENLGEYRCYLVKKIQKHLKNPSIINGTPSDFDEEEGQIRGIYPAVVYPTRDKRRNFTVEQLPLSEGFRVEQNYTQQLSLSADASEARLAFFEKRKASFK